MVDGEKRVTSRTFRILMHGSSGRPGHALPVSTPSVRTLPCAVAEDDGIKYNSVQAGMPEMLLARRLTKPFLAYIHHAHRLLELLEYSALLEMLEGNVA